MLITSRQKWQTLKENEKFLKVFMGGIPVEYTENEKLLGLCVNENLSWENNIRDIVSKINSKLALLRRIKKFL